MRELLPAALVGPEGDAGREHLDEGEPPVLDLEPERLLDGLRGADALLRVEERDALDVHRPLELGDELGVPLQQGASTHNLQRLAKGMGWGPEDSTSVLRVYEMMLKHKVNP